MIVNYNYTKCIKMFFNLVALNMLNEKLKLKIYQKRESFY